MKTLQYDKRIKKDIYQYRLKDGYSLARLPIARDGGEIVTPTGGGSGSTSFVDNGATLALVMKGNIYKIIGSDEITYYLSQGYTLVMQSDNVAKLNAQIPSGSTVQTGAIPQTENNYLPYIIGGVILLILIS